MSKKRLSKSKRKALRRELSEAGGDKRGVRRIAGVGRSELPKRVRDDDVTLTDRYRALQEDEDAELLEETREAMRRRATKRKDVELREAVSDEAARLAAQKAKPEHWRRGVVTKLFSKGCIVESDGQPFDCILRGSLKELSTGTANPVAVGDCVWFELQRDGKGAVEQVEPRRTWLSRTAPRRRNLETVVAANVDQLIIVSSVLQPKFKQGLVDRYLVAAERGGMDAVVCINKIDLADEEHPVPELEFYRELGYQLVFSSIPENKGIEELRDLLTDRTSVLAGHSGTGKSSLLNAVQPGLELKVADVSKSSRKGRHTTIAVTLLPLDTGGYVVDTPGIRSFGLWQLHREELELYFPEIAERSQYCKMSDCSHSHEPQCSVKDAVEAGEITAQRYESFLSIYESLKRRAKWHTYD